MVDLTKKGTRFCPAKEINHMAQEIFHRLREKSYFSGLPKTEFVAQLSDFYQRTNELHPFREGNGRRSGSFYPSCAVTQDIVWTFPKSIWIFS